MAMEEQLTPRLRHTALLFTGVALFLLLSSLATGFGVSLGIDGNLDGEVSITDKRVSPDTPQRFTVEAQNPGGASFTGRIRLDIVNDDNQTVFRAWSDTIRVAPGSLTSHTFLFHDPGLNGTFTAKAVLHHGVERVSDSAVFNASPHETMDGFAVSRIRTYQDAVRVTFDAPTEVGAVAVTVDDEATRRFVQRLVQDASGGTTVTVPYHPAIQDTAEATITISSVDGKYHYTRDVLLTRSTGWDAMVERWWYRMTENLGFT